MKKIAAFLVLLICFSLGFWYVDSVRFQREVEQFLLAHDVQYKDLSLGGFPFRYDVVVVPIEEEPLKDSEVKVIFEAPLIFSKGIFSRNISVETKIKCSIAPKYISEMPESISSGGGFSTKILINDLYAVGALEHILSDSSAALKNPVVKDFESEVILEDFVCYLLKNEKPLLSWDKLVLSFDKNSAVGGVFRAEAQIDLEGLAYREEFWNVASQHLAGAKDKNVEMEKILAMLKAPLAEKQNITLRLGLTAEDDIFISTKTVEQLATSGKDVVPLNESDYYEMFGKLIDAEFVVHASSSIATADVEAKFNSVIIDEQTKQMGYDFHYKAHHSDRYWEMMNKMIDTAATVEHDHDEMAIVSSFAKTWQHFHPHWKDLSFDYGLVSDVERKTLQPKNMALKQLALKVDDMSFAVGIDDQMIDFSRFGLVGEEKIPIVIHQYQRLLGGIVDFGLKWLEEIRKTKNFDMSGAEIPSPQFTKNFLTLVKEISDDPHSKSDDTTITILMGEEGPKKVGTLSLQEVVQKLYQFHQDSVLPPATKKTPVEIEDKT